MEMQMEFKRKLPIPQEIKREFPLSARVRQVKEERDRIIEDIFYGKDDRFLLVIGPCSGPRGCGAGIYDPPCEGSGEGQG